MAGMVPGLRAASTDCSATRDVVGWPTRADDAARLDAERGPAGISDLPGRDQLLARCL